MRYKGHVITEYGRTDNYSFNFFPSGITKQDFMNDVIKDVIQKSPRIPEKAKGSFNYIFVSQFRDINTLPSYMSDNEIDQINEQEMRDMFGDYGERDELNDEPHADDNSNILQQYLNDQKTDVNWSRYSDNGYEVSSYGDKRFSALYATFKKGTIVDNVDVGGKTIEYVYQNIIKKSGKGKGPSKDSRLYNESLKTKEERENFSYYEAYLPLWQEWAKQNPELIEELRKLSEGKTLTDKFASTDVSQARALAEILNNSRKQRPSEKC